MGYLNENGLARYDGLIKNWVTFKSGTVDGIDPLLNWQKTATAGAVTCYPLPAAPIDPVVNFAFTETGPAEGTKGPDNPSTITGVSQAKVTRCGKNLLDVNATFATGNLSATVNIDGSIHVSGTTAAWNYVYFSQGKNPSNKKLPNYIQKGKTYTFSLTTSFENCSFGIFISNSLSSWSSQYTVSPNSSVTVTVGSDAVRAMFRLQVPSGYTTNFDAYIQIEEGDTATSFEKAVPTDYPLPLNGTYYGGSVDLSAGVMTVTWREKTLNGSETTLSSTAGYLLQETTSVYIDKTNLEVAGFIGANGYTNNIACAKFNAIDQATGTEGVRIAQNGNFTLCLNTSRLAAYGYEYGDSVADAVTAVKAWLADNNVTIFYRTTQPVSVSLTPTQIYSLSQPDPYTPRINTVYSDQQSVQVGYPKSPQATSSELTNAIISLGSNL